MAIKNVARGGKGEVRAEVKGLKEFETKLKKLAGRDPYLAKAMWSIIGRASDDVRDEMKKQAQMAGWSGARLVWKSRGKSGTVTGADAINSIFSSNKQQGGNRQRFTALAGVGKRRSMFEWIAGKYPRSPRAKVARGNPVAMSLATALEFGTTRTPAKPAIRTAVENAKRGVIASLANGYKQLVDSLAQ